MSNYEYYNKYGGGYFYKFVKQNPSFAGDEFWNFVVDNNRGDRDAGEVADIAKHEILRLAYEFAEMHWRFPNCYGEPVE